MRAPPDRHVVLSKSRQHSIHPLTCRLRGREFQRKVLIVHQPCKLAIDRYAIFHAQLAITNHAATLKRSFILANATTSSYAPAWVGRHHGLRGLAAP
ncbi:hypothetical protein BLL42_28270 (plasmid) [Pseudomonas frederiksbergensis]|uniref:Uncharacterized protein n=1 Tax=Pseudomonas frederiksbergensis TaxID=104087 RepID=A0A1J0EU38_9PSED|nr:hypothetical protein BLL42_28270 [Pseudomonas frederiksbergensis]